jgi:hypothetical protein
MTSRPFINDLSKIKDGWMVAQPDILGQATKTRKFLPAARTAGFILALISIFSPTAATAALTPPAICEAGKSLLSDGMGPAAHAVFLSTPYPSRNGSNSVRAVPPSAARTPALSPVPSGPDLLLRRTGGFGRPSVLTTSSHRPRSDESLPTAGTSEVPAYLVPGAILLGLIAAMVVILVRAFKGIHHEEHEGHEGHEGELIQMCLRLLEMVEVTLPVYRDKVDWGEACKMQGRQFEIERTLKMIVKEREEATYAG